MVVSKRSYFDWSGGQLHYTTWGSMGAGRPILLCFPPSPFSAVAYKTIAPMLAAKYCVIAVDYPGLGNSDWPDAPITIGLISEAVLELAATFEGKGPIDLLGFHSGTLVAIESVVRVPDLFRNLILIDVPFFKEADRKVHLTKKYGQINLGSELMCLQKIWDSCVSNRLSRLGLERGFELFLDQASLGEKGGVIFEAAFQYDCYGQAGKVTTPTVVIATRAGLYQESLGTHQVIPGAKLVTVEDVSVSVLEEAASKMSDHIFKVV